MNKHLLKPYLVKNSREMQWGGKQNENEHNMGKRDVGYLSIKAAQKNLALNGVDEYLYRNRLIDHIKSQSSDCSIIIQGQAGQGKTVLAIQYMDICDELSMTFRLGDDVSEPINIISGLSDLFKKNVAGYDASLLDEIISKSELQPGEYDKLIKILVRSVSTALSGRSAYLLLDDFHLLKNHHYSVALFSLFFQQAPQNLRFILTSRISIKEVMGNNFDISNWFFIDNNQLSFSNNEIYLLFEKVSKHCLLPEECTRLSRQTKGWALGLSLVARHVYKQPEVLNNASHLFVNSESSFDGFANSLLYLLDELTQLFLLEISLLDEIHLPLISEILGYDQPQKLLDSLLNNNLFIYTQNRLEEIYVLHPLVREMLQRHAVKLLSSERIKEIYINAASFYSLTNNIEKSASYFIKAEDYEGLEHLLSHSGLTLMGKRRILGLGQLLKSVPDEIIYQSAWMSLLSAEIAMNTNPFSAFPLLQRSLELFESQGDLLGELVALAQLINYHGSIDGQYVKGEVLIKRADKIYSDVIDQLDNITRIHVDIFLGGAHLFLHANHARCNLYLSDARQLACKQALDDQQARIGFFFYYQYMVAGDLDMAKSELEQLYKMMANPRVSINNRIMFMGAVANWLYNVGDLESFARHCCFLSEMVDSSLLNKTVIGMFLLRWKAQSAISRAQYSQAARILKEALENGYAAANPHIRSQFLQYQAIVFAKRGESERAIKIARESYKLRQQAGETNQTSYNNLSLGICYLLLKDYKQAMFHLDETVRHGREIKKDYAVAAALVYRALIYLRQGKLEMTQQGLRDFSGIMQENHYTFIENWIPELLTEIFSFSVRSDIAVEFITRLARQHLDCGFDNKGKVIPLLKIRSLGKFDLQVSDDMCLTEDALTSNQKILLSLLLSRPDLCIDLADIQLVLWKESSGDKVRAKQDTLLSRLRKTLKTVIGKADIKNYLSVQNGMLCLKNCVVDHLEFEDFADQGISCLREDKYWEAELKLTAACKCYKGELLPNVNILNALLNKRLVLVEKHIACVTMLADIYNRSERYTQELELLQTAILFYPLDEGVMNKLYRCYINIGQHGSAMRLIKHFHESLKLEGYDDVDIQSIIYQITGKKAFI